MPGPHLLTVRLGSTDRLALAAGNRWFPPLAGVIAQAGERHDMVLAQAASTISGMSDGEIRKIDKEAKKLTIRHGPMPQLDMPSPMTMVYRVKDPAMLDQVKPGDKVKFQAEKIDGAFTVTKIEPAQ